MAGRILSHPRLPSDTTGLNRKHPIQKGQDTSDTPHKDTQLLKECPYWCSGRVPIFVALVSGLMTTCSMRKTRLFCKCEQPEPLGDVKAPL
jgi:hypothetical protein